jgi:hypothetical protein
MPTATGLPKAGDRLYNAYFKQVFIVTGRSSSSFPMTVYVQPTPGKEFPREMFADGRSVRSDGTYGILFEGDIQDGFRMGFSEWTFVPDPNQTSVFTQVCNRDGAHAAHLYMPKRTWFRCPGVKTPERPAGATRAIPPSADQAFATWYGKEFGEELPADDRDQIEAAAVLRSAFEAGRDYENERLKR